MTQYAICLQPYIPMRAEASERSEMVGQLLFGDTFRIDDECPHWFHVVRDVDNYGGWIDWKTATKLTEVEYRRYLQSTAGAPLLRMPFTPVQKSENGATGPAFLSWGSRIYNLDDSGITFVMQQCRFDTSPSAYVMPISATTMSRPACVKFLLQQAQLLLNVPYLWGGCSAFGTDCSGFTQTLFRFIGITLPRDASQQAECGTEVPFEQRQPGDLAFFSRDGRIVHVGLVAEKDQIIHVSGTLHIDRLEPEGIYSATQQCLTHTLASIRHFF
jgi:hypothetical protein